MEQKVFGHIVGAMGANKKIIWHGISLHHSGFVWDFFFWQWTLPHWATVIEFLFIPIFTLLWTFTSLNYFCFSPYVSLSGSYFISVFSDSYPPMLRSLSLCLCSLDESSWWSGPRIINGITRGLRFLRRHVTVEVFRCHLSVLWSEVWGWICQSLGQSNWNNLCDKITPRGTN